MFIKFLLQLNDFDYMFEIDLIILIPSEINIKIALGESEEKREELINELLQLLEKQVVQEITS